MRIALANIRVPTTPDDAVHGQEGLLVADLDLGIATGLVASRCRIPS